MIPALLSPAFLAAAVQFDAFNLPLAGLILAYTFLPVACAYLARHSAPPVWMDFAVIGLLWFPLEFSLGQQWVPKPARNALHLAGYGLSILLGLAIFLLFRRLTGMKYNLPRSGRDFVNLMLGFAASAPVLIALGRAIGFLPPFHWPMQPAPVADRIPVPDYPCRHRAARRNPLSRLDPELHRREIWGRHSDAAGVGVHFWMCASRQRPGTAAQLALHDSGDDRGRGLWKGVRKKLEHLRFSRVARVSRHRQARLLLTRAMRLSR